MAASDWKSIDDLVSAAVADHTAPGAVLVVGNRDGILHEFATGRHTYDENSPAVTIDSLFDLASMTKVVATGTATMLLMGDDKLTSATLVSSVIKGFEANGKETVSILDLATHRSGLKAYENHARVEKTRAPETSACDALITTYASLETSHDPHGKVVYSCLNMQILARVNETIIGERQDAFLAKRVFGPLGMKDTGYELTEEQLARTLPTQRGVEVGAIHDPLARYHAVGEHAPGNAGLFSTGRDLARYCLMIQNGGRWEGRQIIDPAILKWSFGRKTAEGMGDARGFAWDLWEAKPYVTELNREPGREIVGHTGYTGTMIWLDQYTGAWFVLLTNRTWPDDSEEGGKKIAALRKAVADAVLHRQPEYAAYFAAAGN